MSTESTPESRTFLAYLMSEMLALQNLPTDLHQAISNHLNNQLSLVNVLKPEYCRRLYPILLELAELSNGANIVDQAKTDVTFASNGQHHQNENEEDEEHDEQFSAH